ncbi:uncharacterized protein BJX67DRAFT_379735 [Aspergillus lucknowensis]|uniref:Uncharacterized protein n=1 Tax=Aspergillus lucknowensis TaxID=176173 RepID=A0ABR4LW65_9EURO
MPYDVPSWGFDPMNPGPGFNLDPGVAGDEELWYRSNFGVNVFEQPHLQADEHLAGYAFATPASDKTPYQQVPSLPGDAFPSQPDKLSPRFDNLQTMDGNIPSLDDLLRTASQLVTERALYMNIPPANPHSPPYHSSPPPADAYIGSPGASTSHHSNASEADEHDAPVFDFAQVYCLPEGTGNNTTGYFSPPVHQPQSRDHVVTGDQKPQSKAHAEKAKKTGLTPLEMPDGSTRLTANWLPVDPQGGLTIRPPTQHFMTLDPLMMDVEGSHFHPDYDQGHHYNYRDAFISIENVGAAQTGV